MIGRKVRNIVLWFGVGVIFWGVVFGWYVYRVGLFEVMYVVRKIIEVSFLSICNICKLENYIIVIFNKEENKYGINNIVMCNVNIEKVIWFLMIILYLYYM